MCLLTVVARLDCYVVFFFQAEDGIRDLVRSRGLGDVYKRQGLALGMRADSGLVRAGAERAQVTASFEAPFAGSNLSLIHI